MKKIFINDYKKNMQHLLFFDVMIKEQVLNKDAFLESQRISPTSYRRARASEQRVGKQINDKLAKYFNVLIPATEDLERLETLSNSIYFDIYFKVCSNFSNYLSEIDEFLNKNTTLNPLLRLLKLFLNTYSLIDIDEIINNNSDEFNDIKKFQSFFSGGFNDLYELLELIFATDIPKEKLAKRYESGLNYSIISIRYKREKRYFESLYFAQKAKEIFIAENNYKRVIYINFTILNNLSLTGSYDEYYKQAQEQYLTIKSLSLDELVIRNALKHAVVSCIGIKRYDEAKNLLKDIKTMSMTEFCSLVVAKYFLSKNDFYIWVETLDEELKDFSLQIIDYLKQKNKRRNILPFENKIMNSLAEILKWS